MIAKPVLGISLHGEQAIGFAVYFYNYSIWQGCKGLYK